jgi:hypothetical protein
MIPETSAGFQRTTWRYVPEMALFIPTGVIVWEPQAQQGLLSRDSLVG